MPGRAWPGYPGKTNGAWEGVVEILLLEKSHGAWEVLGKGTLGTQKSTWEELAKAPWKQSGRLGGVGQGTLEKIRVPWKKARPHGGLLCHHIGPPWSIVSPYWARPCHSGSGHILPTLHTLQTYGHMHQQQGPASRDIMIYQWLNPDHWTLPPDGSRSNHK